MTIEVAVGGAVIIRIAMLLAKLLIFGVSTANFNIRCADAQSSQIVP